MCFTTLSAPPCQFISPPSSSFDVCLDCGHPGIPQQHPVRFVFTAGPFHICISLPFPSFNVFFISRVCSSSFDPCEICAGTSRGVNLLLRPCGHRRVKMTPELPGADLSLSRLSRLRAYLSTQPRFFSSLNISPRWGQPKGGQRWAGLNKAHVLKIMK